MTDERTHGNGYNLSAGRSDELADLAPLPLDGDDYTWDDDALDERVRQMYRRVFGKEYDPADSDYLWDDDDAALDYEAKLQAAERTIANLRGEMQVQRDGALLLASSVGFVALVTGVIAGALIW